MRRVSTTPVVYVVKLADGRRERVTVGFSVVIDWLPGGDEMWEQLVHPAIFETERQVEGFKVKVEKAMEGKWDIGGINSALWNHSGGSCSPVFRSENSVSSYFIPAAR